MPIWTTEIKEIERLNASLAGHSPLLEKEVGLLLRTFFLIHKDDSVIPSLACAGRLGELANLKIQ